MMHVALVIIVAALMKHADAKRCFECSDMPHPQDCQIVTTCSSHETCYVEQFITTGGQILYSSGCMSKERCQTAGKRSVFMELVNILKRRPISPAKEVSGDTLGRMARQDTGSVKDIPTCVACCEGEFCNVEGCGTLAVPRQKRGPRCFSCDAQADPESCRDTMLCDLDKVCALYKPLNSLAMNEWASECMAEKQCTAIVKLELQQIGKRDVITINQCPRCCTTDFCNHSCRQNLTVTHPTAVPTKPTTKPTTKLVVKLPTITMSHAHVTAKPTAHAHQQQTMSSTAHAHHQHTKPSTAHAHNHHTPTAAPNQHSTQSTTAKAHTHHAHQTKPTTAHAHNHQTPTANPYKHSTQPTTAKAHSHHDTQTKPTTAHAHHNTQSSTIKITQTTKPIPTTDPAVGCKVDGYIYDAPTKLCLKFFESPKLNWTDAQRYCNSSKGQLAIITGDQKIKDVLAFYKNDGYTTPLWVGATDFGNGHVFTFTDGSKLTVDPSSGQDLKNYNCLYVKGGSYQGFGPCPDKHGFICERSSTIRA